MPPKKQSFELLLKSELRQECLKSINRQFGKSPYPIYPDLNNPYFEDFFLLDLYSNQNKWDLIREMMSISGVIEADPVEKVLGIFNKVYDHDNLDQDTHWNHKLTRFPEALKFSRDQKRLREGTKIKIIQLDTGYTKHPEIQGIKHGLGVNFLQDENPKSSIDLLNHKILQQPGHGTSTAGIIIGRKTDQADDKNIGLFPYVDFVPYRISRSVIHFINSHIGAAVKAAVDAGADIITMSMGGAPPRGSWRRAARYAYEKGVIFVAAAGNQVKFVVWPARYSKVIGVAGINNKGRPWEDSCRGKKIQISAPGENVFVARVLERDKYYYSYGSGTSYAAPHVAAAAALWLNHFKEELAAEVFSLRPDLKVAAFHWAIEKSARVPPHWNQEIKDNFGAGILDARNLLNFSPMDFLRDNPESLTRSDVDIDEADEMYDVDQKELCQLILESEADELSDFANGIVNQASDASTNTFGGIAMDVISGDKGSGEGKTLSDIKYELLQKIID